MARALAGHANQAFEVPEGIVFVDIDKDTGKLAAPACPHVFRESFTTGTEPTELCPLHSFGHESGGGARWPQMLESVVPSSLKPLRYK